MLEIMAQMRENKAFFRNLPQGREQCLYEIRNGKLIWAQCPQPRLEPITALASTNLNGGVDLWVLERADDYRRWTSRDGKFSTKAACIELKTHSVRLRKEDGKIIEVPIAKLSEGDREVIDETRMSQKLDGFLEP